LKKGLKILVTPTKNRKVATGTESSTCKSREVYKIQRKYLLLIRFDEIIFPSLVPQTVALLIEAVANAVATG